MKNFELTSFATAAELAHTVAGAWLDEITAVNRAGKPHFVALSGGRITQKFFAAVVEISKARSITLSGVHFFWADERCVPPTDPESNFALADRLLFKPLGIAPDRIHRIQGELPPDEAATAATDEITRLAPINQSGHPVLDIVFLGMGEDGHVASLFPGETEAVRQSAVTYRAVVAPKPPSRRITLGYATIAAARQVWVLASGSGKEAALHESLSPDGPTPLANVLKRRPNTRIFTDLRSV